MAADASAAAVDPDRYLDDERFHRSFTLHPAGPDRPKPFTVTYSDYGYRNVDEPQKECVLLMCSPLLGSRYLYVTKDKLAKKHGIRIINPDRPGFGGTTDVEDPADRVRVWLEMIPALLQHLGISRVSAVVGSSGGAIYALNTVLYLRDVLLPDPRRHRLYVGLCAPWIHPVHSGVRLTRLLEALPEGLVAQTNRVGRFVNTWVGPVLGFSGGIVATSSASVPGLGGSKILAPGADADDVEFEERVRDKVLRRTFAEDTAGMGKDAILFLRKREGTDHPENWGSWVDYDRYVPLLADTQQNATTTSVEGVGGGGDGHIQGLRVDVFWAESDVMVGTKAGPEWFDNCWRPEQRGDGIQYNSCVIPGANHDFILDLRFGVAERIFRAVAEMES